MKCTWMNCENEAVYVVKTLDRADSQPLERDIGVKAGVFHIAYNCEHHVPKRTAKDYQIETA